MNNGKEIREEVSKHFINHMPNINDYKNSQGRYKFVFNTEINDCFYSDLRIKYTFLSSSIADINNTTNPTSSDSNSIKQTDNNLSNEAKINLKILISKGLSIPEIIEEYQNVYGIGISLNAKNKFYYTSKSQLIFCYSFFSLFLGISGLKIYKLIYRLRR